MGICSIHLAYAGVLMLGSMTFGYVLSYPSLALLEFTEERNWEISEIQETLFSSIPALMAIPGTFICAFLLRYFGRRPTTSIIACFGTFSWGLLLTLRKEYFWFGIFSRGLLGITIGAFSSVIPMYIVELSPPESSGFFGSLNQLGIAFGIVVVYLIGSFRDFRETAVIGTPFTILLSILVWFIPESPVSTEKKNENQEKSKGNIFQRKYAKPLFVCVMLMVFQQFCGINAILTNLAQLFKEAGVDISAGIASAIATIAQVISVFIGAVIVDKLGRKLCWALSFGLMSISLCLYCIHTQKSMGPIIPIVIVFFYLLAFGLGAGAIPWFIVSEMFDSEVRHIAQSIVSASNWALAFTVMTAYSKVEGKVGPFWCFIFFTVVSVLSVIFGIVFIKNPQDGIVDEPLLQTSQ